MWFPFSKPRGHVMLKSLKLKMFLMISLAIASPAFGDAIYNVSINTLSISGQPGKVVFDWIVNSPPTVGMEVVNFTATAPFVAGLPETQGGLVTGDAILPPFVPFAVTEIEGGSFFNELTVNFSQLGPGISFQV